MDFVDYQSKPITRRAYCITSSDTISYDPNTHTGVVTSGEEEITFASYEGPVVGDFVVYLNADDIYHCSAAVFAERNIV